MGQNKNDLNNIENYKEFDLNEILESIKRKKKIFFSIATSVLFFSFCYAFTRKPIWEGKFQIVLNQTQQTTPSDSVLDSLGVMGFGIPTSNRISLNTEVEILQSPAVLKPVFDFVKDQQEKKGEVKSNFRFNDWSQQISISLKPKTFVLDFYYRDENKDLILPVINRISDAYKDYPDRDKNKNISKSIKYFEDQISYYLDLNAKSFRKYIDFALENDLTILQTSASRIFNADPVFKLKKEIEYNTLKLNELENINVEKYNDKILPLNLYIPDSPDFQEMSTLVKNNLYTLMIKRQSFTEEDRVIKDLKNSIKNLNHTMHRNAKDYLKQKISINENRLKLITKPKNVLIRAKELQREIVRLENIINNLENNKQMLSLQLSKNNSPWELITTPTLKDSPVYPKKKQIVLLGLFGGIILGIAASLYIENFSGLIYSLKELKFLIDYKFLKEIDKDDEKDIEDSLGLVGRNINKISNIKNVGLVFITNLLDKEIENVKKSLLNQINNINLVDSNNFSELGKCDSIILILEKGAVTKKQLAEYDQKIKLLNLPVIGWIFLKS